LKIDADPDLFLWETHAMWVLLFPDQYCTERRFGKRWHRRMRKLSCSSRVIALSFIAVCVVVLVLLVALRTPSIFEDKTTNVSTLQVNSFISEAAKYYPDARFEREAVQVAISNSQDWSYRVVANNIGGNVLCVTFMELSAEAVQRHVENMQHTKNTCYWVYMIYKYNIATKNDLLDNFNRMLSAAAADNTQGHTINFDVVFAPPRNEIISDIAQQCKNLRNMRMFSDYRLENPCSRIEAAERTQYSTTGISYAGSYNAFVYPKVLLFMKLLWQLTNYRYVWIIDGDISLKGHDIAAFVQTARCAFDTPSLIAQPTVAENTQTYQYLNKRSWRYSKAIAAQTGFVEIQVPLIDAQLFQWYVLRFVLPLVIPVHILGADWGFDELFCRAAQLYSTVTSHEYQRVIAYGVVDSAKKSPVPAGALDSAQQATQQETLRANLKAALQVAGLDEDHGSEGSPGMLSSELPRAMVVGADIVPTAVAGSSEHPQQNAMIATLIERSAPQCAVILRGGAVNHADGQETNAILGYSAKKALNEKMRKIVRMAFPTFYAPGKGVPADPLENGTKLKKSTALQPACKG
jgi:nitroreductase